MTLAYLSRQLTIYIGIFLFIAGMIGNTMNIVIFSSTDTYRKNPSTMCFLLNSICSCLYLLVILTTRIISFGFDLEWTSSSVVWCKTRPFLISILVLSSLTFSSMATVDQFLITSKNVRLRQFSNIKRMQLVACTMIILWCLHGIPFFLYYDIPSTSQGCLITNSTFRHYMVAYTLIFLCAIPVLIVSVFGYLTFRNIRQSAVLVEQRADRQITKMTLLQVLLIIVSVTPTGVFSAYTSITEQIVKDAQRLDKEILASTITALMSYLYFVGNFYMFLVTSSRFRSLVRHRMNHCCKEKQVFPSITIYNEN